MTPPKEKDQFGYTILSEEFQPILADTSTTPYAVLDSEDLERERVRESSKDYTNVDKHGLQEEVTESGAAMSDLDETIEHSQPDDFKVLATEARDIPDPNVNMEPTTHGSSSDDCTTPEHTLG